MVVAENLVVVIAESQWTGFNLQGCRKIPSQSPERRHEGLAFTLPYFLLIRVEVTLIDNTAGFPSGHFFHEASFNSSNLRVSTQIF